MAFVVLLLVAMVLPNSSLSENIKLEVSCGFSGLKIHVKFDKPFKGAVYAKDHFYNPSCSFIVPPLSETKELNLTLPLTKCGTSVEKRSHHLWIINKLVFQHHITLKTVSDDEEVVICKPNRPMPAVFWAMNLLNYAKKTDDYSKPESWLEIQEGSELFSEKVNWKLKLENSLLVVIHVNDNGNNKDVNVKNCIAHKEWNINNSSLQQLNNPFGCGIESEFLSKFQVTNETKYPLSDLTAYAELNKTYFESAGYFYVTCGVELCRDSCQDSCREMENRPYKLMTIARNTFFKRSAPLAQSSGNSLLKTIKDLTSKILKSRQNSKSLKSSIELEDLNFLATTDYTTYTPNTEFDDTENLSTESSDIVPYTPTELDDLSVFKLPAEAFDYLTSDTSQLDIETSTSSIAYPTEIVTYISQSTSAISTNYTLSEFDEETNETLRTLPSLIVEAENASNFSDSIRNSTMTSFNHNIFKSNSVLNLDDFMKNCVSRSKFNVVTTILCSALICLILFCVGISLYLRKEQKRHLVDNFLLYSF